MRAIKRIMRWFRRQRFMVICGHTAPDGYASCDGCHVWCCPRCFAQHVTEHYPMSSSCD